MEYVCAALILNESDEEVDGENITTVLEAAGIDVEEPRVKALIAALEDVDIKEAIEAAATTPAPVAGGSTGDEVETADGDDEEDVEEEAADKGGDGDGNGDEEADGEDLGAPSD